MDRQKMLKEDRQIRKKARAVGLKVRIIVPGLDSSWEVEGCTCRGGHIIKSSEAIVWMERFERALAGNKKEWDVIHGPLPGQVFP